MNTLVFKLLCLLLSRRTFCGLAVIPLSEIDEWKQSLTTPQNTEWNYEITCFAEEFPERILGNVFVVWIRQALLHPWESGEKTKFPSKSLSRACCLLNFPRVFSTFSPSNEKFLEWCYDNEIIDMAESYDLSQLSLLLSVRLNKTLF